MMLVRTYHCLSCSCRYVLILLLVHSAADAAAGLNKPAAMISQKQIISYKHLLKPLEQSEWRKDDKTDCLPGVWQGTYAAEVIMP